MKRIILTTAALALTVLTVSAKPNKKDENKVIDKLKYTITYQTKSVRDTTKQILQVGTTTITTICSC